MNFSWNHTCNLREQRFNVFTNSAFVISSVSGFCSLAVAFSFRVMPNVFTCLHQIFKFIIGISAIRNISASLREMHRQRMHSFAVVPSAGNNGKFNRHSINGGNHLYAEAVKILAFGNTFAPIFFVQRKKAIAEYANVMAYRYRKTIHYIFHAGVKLLDGFSHRKKNRMHEFFYGMNPPAETTFFQHTPAHSLLPNITQRPLVVASKIQSSQERGKHYFGIVHHSLFIFLMVDCFEVVIQKAVNCNGIVYHDFYKGWLNSPLLMKSSMDFAFLNSTYQQHIVYL